ncbi:MAG: hypothetical protein ACI39G_05955 [Pseudoramibacter sp.]
MTKAYLKNTLEVADNQVQYDTGAKKVIASTQVMALILNNTVEEFKNSTQEEVEAYLRSDQGQKEVHVGTIGVDTDHTNPDIVTSHSEEDHTLTEGIIYYDVFLYAPTPDEKTLLVDVEAQRKYNPGYPLVKRGLYYASRMISSQMGRDINHNAYGKIRKVYSIWLCMHPPKQMQNRIVKYAIKPETLYQEPDAKPYAEKKDHYDLINVVMVGIGDGATKPNSRFLRILQALFSEKLSIEAKYQALNEEQFLLDDATKQEVDNMCNLSQGIYEEGIAHGVAQGIAQGIEQGKAEGVDQTITIISLLNNNIAPDAIAKQLHLSIETVQKVKVALNQYNQAKKDETNS